MAKKFFINKDNQELPDSYTITIEFVTGKKKEYNVASHLFVKEPLHGLELKLFEDIIVVIPVTNIVEISFDKNFNKIMEIKKKLDERK
jgi:hypothetical protein